MLRKIILFAITSGLAGKAYRAIVNRQRQPAASGLTIPRRSAGTTSRRR